MATIVPIIVAAFSIAGTAYTAYSAKRGRDAQKAAADDAARAQQKAATQAEAARAAAEEEARNRAETLRLEQQRLKDEAERQKQEEAERKQTILGVQSNFLMTGRKSLLATEASVWESRPAVKKRTILGASDTGTQLKSIFGA